MTRSLVAFLSLTLLSATGCAGSTNETFRAVDRTDPQHSLCVFLDLRDAPQPPQRVKGTVSYEVFMGSGCRTRRMEYAAVQVPWAHRDVAFTATQTAGLYQAEVFLDRRKTGRFLAPVCAGGS